jgi:hypothetical protein
MDSKTLLMLGGASSLLAIPALLLAGYFLVLFFGGRGDRYGSLNDFFSAVTLLLLILPALGVYKLGRDDAGAWFTVVTWLAVAGMLIGALGQFALVLKLISLGASFVTGGLGITPVIAWGVSIAALSITRTGIPHVIGWTAIAALCLTVLLITASGVHQKTATNVLAVALSVALVAWFGAMGIKLVAADA